MFGNFKNQNSFFQRKENNNGKERLKRLRRDLKFIMNYRTGDPIPQRASLYNSAYGTKTIVGGTLQLLWALGLIWSSIQLAVSLDSVVVWATIILVLAITTGVALAEAVPRIPLFKKAATIQFELRYWWYDYLNGRATVDEQDDDTCTPSGGNSIDHGSSIQSTSRDQSSKFEVRTSSVSFRSVPPSTFTRTVTYIVQFVRASASDAVSRFTFDIRRVMTAVRTEREIASNMLAEMQDGGGGWSCNGGGGWSYCCC